MKNKKYITFSAIIFILILIFGFKANTNSPKKNSFTPCNTIGSVILSDQEDVDDWVAEHAGCTIINGALSIGTSSFNVTSDINDISGLMSLEEINGAVTISQTSLTNLSGLNNIQSTSYGIRISKNANLTDLTALSSLQTIGNSSIIIEDNFNLPNLNGLLQNIDFIETFEITNNANLTSLDGLEGLLNVKDLFITNNSNLTSLQGLTNLSTANDLRISSCSSLTTLLGLESLTTTGNLYLSGNTVLENLNGLENLVTIKATGSINTASGLGIIGCPSLLDFTGLSSLSFVKRNVIIDESGITSFNGLGNLDSVGNAFWVDDCPNLISMNGLDDLTKIGQNFQIRRNNQLDDLSGFENLEEILGYFIIQDNDSLTNLNGLENLVTVSNIQIESNENLTSLVGLNSATNFEGRFRIGTNNSLTSLVGLENFTYIPDLILFGNQILSDLSALANLTNTNSIFIHNNNLLADLNGFNNLNNVQERLYIGNNDILTDLTSLRNLTGIGTDLVIEKNDILENLKGFQGLQFVFGNIEILQNPSLHQLRGLDNIKTVGGFFTIYDNNLLYKINSLRKLENIAGDFSIYSNDILQSIDGLDKLVSVGGELGIYSNSVLSYCNVHFVCRHLINSGESFFTNNKEGCNDTQAILSECGFSSFTGKVVLDNDSDCIADAEEFTLQGWKVMATSSDFDNITFTDAQGEYILHVDSGMFNINVIPPSSIWQPCINTQTYTFAGSYDTINVDFANQSLVDCPAMVVDVNSGPIRRCMDSRLIIDYCNLGSAVGTNAYVDLFLNDFFGILDASIPYTLDGTTATFQLGDLNPGACGNFWVDVNVFCEANQGQTLCVTAFIHPDTICEIPSSAWVEADLFVSSRCDNDQVTFFIENTGVGDMVDPTEYRVYKDGIPHDLGEVLLLAEEVFEISYPKDGATYRMEVDQVEDHPKITTPGITIEACAEDGDPFTTGYALQFPIEDYDDNFDRHCLPITGSFDPNDKRGFPLGFGVNNFIEANDPIDYIIRFQNTGNDTAFLVVILDTLPQQLDPNSIELKGSSHDYRMQIIDSNIIEFTFENIFLPDSNINEVASHGYVAFKIDQQLDLPIGTEIINSAAIYFDFNEPVITDDSYHSLGRVTFVSNEDVFLCEGESYEGVTYIQDTILADTLNFGVVGNIFKTNIEIVPSLQFTIDTTIQLGNPYQGIIYQNDTTLQENFIDQYGCDSIVTTNILVNTVSTETIHLQNPSVSISPNPFSNQTTFTIKNVLVENGTIEVFNTTGKRVLQNSNLQNQFNLLKGNLSRGLYFYKISIANEKIITGKFIIQ